MTGKTSHSSKPADRSTAAHTVSTCDKLPFQFHRLKNSISNFRAGKIAQFKDSWANLTADREILKWIDGVQIDFSQTCKQWKVPQPFHFNVEEVKLMQQQLDKMITKGVIEETKHEDGIHLQYFLQAKERWHC